MRIHARFHLLWVPLAVLVSFSIYFALKWGLRPKAVPQINPTRFEEPEQIGAVLYRRLRPIFRQEKLVVLGSAPWIQSYDRIWNGFIAAAREDQLPIEALYQDPSLKALKDFTGLKTYPLIWPSDADLKTGELRDLTKDLRVGMRAGRLVLIHTGHQWSSHMTKNSLTRTLESLLRRPWAAVTLLSLSVDLEGLESAAIPCNEISLEENPQRALGCASARISRKFMRKRLDPKHLWGALERHGLKDYFLFVYEPNAQ